MYISATTLDDLLHRVFQKLLETKHRIDPTRGRAAERVAVLLRLTNPRARLSRTETKGRLFSCLGELLWYLAGTKNLKFISYYLSRYQEESEDGRSVYGGYGPRLFGKRKNQVANILALLRRGGDSRRAVIQLFDSNDISKPHKEIPCTCTLQFMLRQRRLHMLTNMRSNDAFLGLPHDLFAFTMFQEIIARTLGAELGAYYHTVGSLHLYEKDREKARRYLKEGWQPTAAVMPPLPKADPWGPISKVLKAERAIRHGHSIKIADLNLQSYWEDLVRLLQIFRHFKTGEIEQISRLKHEMSVHAYDVYIDDKRKPQSGDSPSGL
jgi:thymidylate synthase